MIATTQNNPNIVFILVDDMGYGDFSAFNDGLSKTPTLDALMSEGVCLTQHYTASPVCNPSRAALLTGRYPHRTGSIDTLEWRGLERLALRERTLAQVLQEAGYVTGHVGKWHLGAFDPRYHPARRGFDETVCFRGGMHDYFDWRIEWGTNRVGRGDGRYLTDIWTEEAVQFLNRHKDEPFFLHVNYNAPHTPLQAPEHYIRQFDHLDEPWGVKCIYAMLLAMDEGVARILDALRRFGLQENTLVVFSSDNGPQFGGTGDEVTTRFNCGRHGAKGSTYEGGIRVPGILRWPAGGMDGGRTTDAMVHFTDYFPTLLGAAGVPLPDHATNVGTLPIDGVNVLPVLRGDGGETCTRRCWQWNRYSPVVTCNAAARDGEWKLVRPAIPEAMKVHDIGHLHTTMYHTEYFIENGIFHGDPARTIPDPPPAELYNLSDDPGEEHECSAEHPEIVDRLTRQLEEWFKDVEADRRRITDEWALNPEPGWPGPSDSPTSRSPAATA